MHLKSKKKADYLLAVKGNQGELHQAFEERFPVSLFSNYEGDSFSTQEISHGRKETHLHIVSDVTSELNHKGEVFCWVSYIL